MDVPKLVEFLAMVAGGGFSSVVVAFLLEHWPWFQSLESETKKWIVLAVYVVLPVGATALLQNVPPEFWEVLQPYWNALALGFVGWVGSQIAHAWDKQRKLPK